VTPVIGREAPQFGLVRTDEESAIVEFVEKPTDPEILRRLAVAPRRSGEDPAEPRTHLASMGIYIFRMEVLEELLRGEGTDFGQHLLPEAVATRRVAAFRFDGYWQDLGTIASYHRANLELADRLAPVDFFAPRNPVHTRPSVLPASRVSGARLDATLLSEGCILEADATVVRSVLGPRSVVRRGTRLARAVVFGSSSYEDAPPAGLPRLGIGERCSIRDAIIDRDVRIGDDVVLENVALLREHANPYLFVREGVIVVPKGTVIPSGYRF
jgi:glucose-1-phosphate adenylyltransferase